MSLVLYSSSDSDEEDEKKNSKHFKSSSSDNDRIRLFPDERGNWALSIYTYGKIKIFLILIFLLFYFLKLNVHHIWIQ